MTENGGWRSEQGAVGVDPGYQPEAETDRREQQEVDAVLRGVARGQARTELSPAFHRKLRARLAVEWMRHRRMRRHRLLMQVYWASAAVASFALLALIRWPAGLPAAAAVYLASLLFVVALITPLLLLLRRNVSVMRLLAGAVAMRYPQHHQPLERSR